MEDRQTNRLRESLNIFETIVNNRVFVNVSIILFLNKTDLLEEKVKSVPLKDYFPEYTGTEHSLPEIQAFMVDCFRAKRRDATQKPLYHHFTTAINTENIRLVFRDVKDTILHDNLKQLMLQWPLSTCERRGPERGQTTPSLLTRTWERPASEESDRCSSSPVFILVFTLLFEELAFLLVQGLVGERVSRKDCVGIKKVEQAVWMLASELCCFVFGLSLLWPDSREAFQLTRCRCWCSCRRLSVEFYTFYQPGWYTWQATNTGKVKYV